MSSPIRDFNKLVADLGDEFLVWCGSAVSAGPRVNDGTTEFLPLVPDVTAAFFRELAARLNGGRYADRVVARYALALVEGKHASLRRRAKFEEFLLLIESAFNSREAVGSVLTALFHCGESEYNHNHAAIGALLRRSAGGPLPRATACLTTNFDNAIEAAYPGLVLSRNVFAIDQHPERLDGGALVKVHGDVVTRQYLATSADIWDEQQKRRLEYIPRLLQGRKVLVVGYSGSGDIDLMPQLEAARESRATFVWGVHSSSQRPWRRPVPAPPVASAWFPCELRSTDARNNWLVALAGPNAPPGGRASPPWRQRLHRWFCEIDDAHADALAELVSTFYMGGTYGGGAGWPVLHMHHVREELEGTTRSPSEVRAIRRVQACLGVAAYHSAKRDAETLEKTVPPLSAEMEAARRLWLAFALWRLGALGKALDEIEVIALQPDADVPPSRIMEIRRVYLEVARDQIRHERQLSSRLRVVNERPMRQICDLLVAEQRQDFVSDFLIDLVIGDIALLLEEAPWASVRTPAEIFRDSMRLHIWFVAEAAARLLIRTDIRAGTSLLIQVDRILVERGNWNTVRKSVAALLDALIAFARPWTLDLLDGPLLAHRKTKWIEDRYSTKLQKWRSSYDVEMRIE